jgi:glycyl-tRNA synthetase beta chain
MATLLFEIGCEELPASACTQARGQLREGVERLLGIPPAQLLIGPRRLAVIVTDLPDRTADEWVKGPPLSAGERAAASFAQKQGVSTEELTEREGFLGVTRAGRPLAGVLPEQLAELVRGLSFSKSMRWNGGGLSFPRPIRWLCAKLDEHTVEIPLEGIPTGGVSVGHRFTDEEVEIESAGVYADRLREVHVESDTDMRADVITRALRDKGLESPNAAVLEEVTYLVEWPEVLDGAFDERFLQLPERVIVTAMESHQRYFPLGGNRFAFVANGGDPDTVREGNERVLEGRLEDASFTFERDVARGIDELVKEIGAITFVAGAGTYADKTVRLQALVEDLGGGEASREAARLAKADQASELVREFPDLEGHIGAEYARLVGYPEAVCAAIDEHYLPDAADAPLPQTEAGRVLSAADKIDNLTVAFARSEQPSGSRDPYGLRRAAIGLCRLAVEGGLEIDVQSLVAHDVALLKEQGAEIRDDASDVSEFVLERLEGLLDVPVEFVRAARRGAASELGAVARLAQTLAESAASEHFERAYVAYDRANRLAGRADGAAPSLDPKLATDEAELALITALESASPRIEAAVQARDFEQALAAAAELGPIVDRFFDEVLVMADDSSVRANRLRLLLDVRDAVGALGDLSQIPR